MIFAVYLIIGLLMVRPIAGHLAWALHYQHLKRGAMRNSWGEITNYRLDAPNTFKWFWATFYALLFAAVWPVVIVWVFSSRVVVGAEKQSKLEARERQIAETERELGLR